jgi:hypothetical protein
MYCIFKSDSYKIGVSKDKNKELLAKKKDNNSFYLWSNVVDMRLIVPFWKF